MKSDFAKDLQSDFNQLSKILGEALFAAYLLGFDSAREETAPLIKKVKSEFSIHKKPYKYVQFSDEDKLVEDAGLLQLRFDVPPSEAIDYFKRKNILPAKEFYELGGEARAAAFTVGGIYEQDILKAFRQEIENALSDGTASGKVIDNFKKILSGAAHKELGDFHLETVLSRLYLENLIRLLMKESYFCGQINLKRVFITQRIKKPDL